MWSSRTGDNQRGCPRIRKHTAAPEESWVSPRLALPLHLGGTSGGPQGRCSLWQGLGHQAQGGCGAPSVLRSGSAVRMRKLVGKLWGKGHGCRTIRRSFHGGLGSLTPGLSEARPSASPRIARFKGRQPHLICAFNAKATSTYVSPELTAICPRGLPEKRAYPRPHRLLPCSMASKTERSPLLRGVHFGKQALLGRLRTEQPLATVQVSRPRKKPRGLKSDVPGLERSEDELMWEVVSSSVKVGLGLCDLVGEYHGSRPGGLRNTHRSW